MNALLVTLRPRQWIKNGVLWLPLLFGRKLFAVPESLHVAAATTVFSMVASAAYVMNDLVDQDRDRVDPFKRLRPIAAGTLSRPQAWAAAAALGTGGILGAAMLGRVCLGLVVLYLGFNLWYSRVLKHLVIIDVMCIAAFFLLRLVAGSVVARVELSHWILALGALLALFLGLNKRRQELLLLGRRSGHHREVLKRYSIAVLDQMIGITTSSIVIAYFLYAVDDRTLLWIGWPALLSTAPLVYYGLFRYLYLVHTVRQYGDPTHILFSDRVLGMTVLVWLAASVVIVYKGFGIFR